MLSMILMTYRPFPVMMSARETEQHMGEMMALCKPTINLGTTRDDLPQGLIFGGVPVYLGKGGKSVHLKLVC